MKILVGIATTNRAELQNGQVFRSGPDKRFLETLPSFFNDCGKRFPDIQFETMFVWNKKLYEAQNDFAQRLLEVNHDYLLTIEDDHWAFTADMLEGCLNANTHVCGIPYRSRHFPFDVVPMRYAMTDSQGKKLFSGMNDPSLKGYHEADLIGFGFTLIKADCFRILDRPFFKENILTYKGVGPHATDIDFCDRLIAKGIKPIGCFDYRLNHRDITENDYKEMLVAGVLTQHSMFNTIQQISRYKKVSERFKKNQEENSRLKNDQPNKESNNA